MCDDTHAFLRASDEVDVEAMQLIYQDEFPVDAFYRLFQSELGKGVLVGVFMGSLKLTYNQMEAEGYND